MTKISKRSPAVGAETTTAEAEPTLADWLALSRPHLSTKLVDDEAFEWLVQMGRHLPDDVMAAIEVRLEPGKTPVDLSVRFMEPQQGLRVAPHLPPACDSLEQFFHDWADGAPATRGTHSLWLEFDGKRMTSRSLPKPVVCVRLRRDLDADNGVGNLLPRMGGVTLPSVQRQILRDAWKERTSTVFPMYLFSLHAREQQAVRLEMYGDSLESLVEWLTRIGHPRARRLDERIVILQIADRFHISCDVGPEGWLDRVGIEASFRHWPRREPGWRRLFTGLVEQELCTPSKEKAVWEWPGYEADSRGFSVRALSHVKISAKPDAAPQAKVYFLLQKLERAKS